MLTFEITAACDAKCIHCPRLDMDRPMRVMPMDLFRRMIDQAAELQIPDLCPNGYGEICTIPAKSLAGYLDYISLKHPRSRLIVNTNGNRMDEEPTSLLVKHGVHLVNVSIDGATAETAESIRVGLDFDQIEANIKRLIAIRNAAGARRPKVRVAMVAMPQTIPEREPFFERWRGIADYVGMGAFSSRLTSVADSVTRPGLPLIPQEAYTHHRKASACRLPFSELIIWSDGKA